jgi:protein farnesyltransferase subunit beta
MHATPGPVSYRQTYEGGLGGEPGNEAHGGYTFCGVAALVLAGEAGVRPPGAAEASSGETSAAPDGGDLMPAVLDVPRLLRWLANRQASRVAAESPPAWGPMVGCVITWQDLAAHVATGGLGSGG